MSALPNQCGAHQSSISALNETCFCLPVERADIDRAILTQSDDPSIVDLLGEKPHLFAQTGVFLSADDLYAMMDQVHAIEATVDQSAYKSVVLARHSTALETVQKQTRGVLMGYDFHITEKGPRLIEVNTNAGGAFLVQALGQSIGNNTLPGYMPYGGLKFDQRIGEMLRSEWRLAGRFGAPKTLAIVDADPATQYLYPDMMLARAALQRQGIDTIIVDVADLAYENGKLMVNGRVVDMVYNRLTDFSLSDPSTRALSQALLNDHVVVSPSPRHHALYADKRNLPLLAKMVRDGELGLPDHHVRALANLPDAKDVTPTNAAELWDARKGLFFKPAGGFGGAAAYRGDKLTKRTWDMILNSGNNYIAQAFVPPALRGLTTENGNQHLKFDIRIYTYAGDPLMLAARVYQGQTTNFRTKGGGFAAVVVADV